MTPRHPCHQTLRPEPDGRPFTPTARREGPDRRGRPSALWSCALLSSTLWPSTLWPTSRTDPDSSPGWWPEDDTDGDLARERSPGYDLDAPDGSTGDSRADGTIDGTGPQDPHDRPSPAPHDRAERPRPTPDTPPHPVDDAAWRYVHELDDPRPGEGTPPFGLPVLAEIPALATVLEQLREADRLIARALEGILLLQDHGDVPGTTGVGLETWISTVARRTRSDARMLLAAAEMARRLPTLRSAFQSGALSWAQVRSVALKTRSLPRHLDARVDHAVAEAIDGMGGCEPDAVTRVITWALTAIRPQEVRAEEEREASREFLAMQPRLDGSGGRIWGEFSATSWAVLDTALNTLHEAASSAPDADPTGRLRAARLVDILDTTLTGGQPSAVEEPATQPDDDDGHDGHDDHDGGVPAPRPQRPTPVPPGRSRPQLLLRADLDLLLDRSEVPGELLTTLLGGRVRVSATTARRLIDERGVDLRTVIIDDTGSVVGVGRQQRLAPGWLTDATLALHDTCSAPGCLEAARTCQSDHARPWHPARPDDQPGRTDVAEIAPLCANHNLTKERDGWTVRQSADGIRRWFHPRSGLATRTVPGTWRPPGRPTGSGAPGDPPAQPPGPDPPS